VALVDNQIQEGPRNVGWDTNSATIATVTFTFRMGLKAKSWKLL
jgi:hypothetical protein